jgi:hypothetical protein
MMSQEQHCKPVTKAPVAAATALMLKLDALDQIIARLVLAERQSAWKITGGGGDTAT